jgi:hypothetical protein
VHALDAADDDHVGLAVAHVLQTLADGHSARGTGALDPGGGGVDAQGLGHQRAHVALVLGQFAHEVADVQGVDVVAVDPSVVDSRLTGVSEQVSAGTLGILPELRHTDPGDVCR